MAYQQPHAGGTPPSNYLAASIVAIFCCWPFAIPAIIQANKVNTLWAQGDVAGAHEASKQAKKWMTIAFILGSIGLVLSFILNMAGALTMYSV